MTDQPSKSGSLPVIDETGEPISANECALWLERKYARRSESEDLACANLIRNQVAEIERLQAILLEMLGSATALHCADGRVMSYQIYPKDMDALLASVRGGPETGVNADGK